MHKLITPVLAAALVASVPAIAQMAPPGAPDASRVLAGGYKVDVNHTQVIWSVNHMGISLLSGSFGASGGSLQIDPVNLAAAKVAVTFNIAEVSTNAAAFTKHLMSAEIFDAAKFPTATFTSTSVQADGDHAKITGNLTIHGVTKPVTLDAKFFGAGPNAINKKLEIGFSATGAINRSDFGLTYVVPLVSDRVDLHIHAAFERIG